MIQLPIVISEEPMIVGTLKVRISVHRETQQSAIRQGVDAEELQNLVEQKILEVQESLGKYLEE